jgi:hypothetical protein
VSTTFAEPAELTEMPKTKTHSVTLSTSPGTIVVYCDANSPVARPLQLLLRGPPGDPVLSILEQ